MGEKRGSDGGGEPVLIQSDEMQEVEILFLDDNFLDCASIGQDGEMQEVEMTIDYVGHLCFTWST